MPSIFRKLRRDRLAAAAREALAVTACLYLCCLLALGAPLREALWGAGGHATPEDWTRHALLDRLGLHDHHGPLQDPVPFVGDWIGGLASGGNAVVVADTSWETPLSMGADLLLGSCLMFAILYISNRWPIRRGLAPVARPDDPPHAPPRLLPS